MALELAWNQCPGFSTPAASRLLSYDWPGNVRGLRNVVERAVYRWEDPERPVDAVQFDPFESPWRPLLTDDKPALTEPERRAVQAPPPATASDPASCADFRLAGAGNENALLSAAPAKCPLNTPQDAPATQPRHQQPPHHT